ncbi:MAG: glycosyltransferase [Thermoanaerobaculia bacterium]|nr:glycosyltransferase [Thermoanaerobaculia bacterium]
MRVGVLAHSFPRFPGDTHGPFVERLSEEIAHLGHEVHVLVPHDPKLVCDRPGPLTVHGFRYIVPESGHLLGYSRTLKRDRGLRLLAWLEAPLYFFFAERALRRLVRRQRLELLHAHWILPNGFVAARTAEAAGIPLAVTLHGSDVFMAEQNALFGALARRALAGAAHVTSCSPDLAERLAALGDDADRNEIHLVPNGTDLPTSDPDPGAARARFGLPSEDRVILAVGRLVDKKGFRYLIEALPAILETEPRARVVIGGGGELGESLEELADRLGVGERVTFTGALSHDEVLALMAAGDVFVMPSVRDDRGNVDGLPIVVLEAMAAARPVVATDVAGLGLAVRPGVTGDLVPEKDPGALATAIGSLLENPERAREQGRAGRRRVERELNWAAIARRHDRLYHRAKERSDR